MTPYLDIDGIAWKQCRKSIDGRVLLTPHLHIDPIHLYIRFPHFLGPTPTQYPPFSHIVINRCLLYTGIQQAISVRNPHALKRVGKIKGNGYKNKVVFCGLCAAVSWSVCL